MPVIPLLAASVLCQAGYYYSSVRAYEGGDFFLVYPVSRGTTPVLVMLWATLFLHEHPHPVGLLGILLIVLGVTITSGLWRLLHRAPTRGPLKIGSLNAAFLVALFISGYSTLDGAAVKRC